MEVNYNRMVFLSKKILRTIYPDVDDHTVDVLCSFGVAAKYLNQQPPEILVEIVKQNGAMLKDIKKQTLEICIEAVKQNPAALQYVDKAFWDQCLYYLVTNQLKV